MIELLKDLFKKPRSVQSGHEHKFMPILRGYPQRICKCGAMKIGRNTITLSPGGSDVVRWSASQASLALGDIGMDVTTGRPSAFIGGADTPLANGADSKGYIHGAKLVFTSVTTVTAGEAGVTSVMRDSANSFDISFSGTIAAVITSSGAGGLDTGVEASNTWYAIHVIADSALVNATALMLSTSATAPTMPAGYDKFRRIGWVRNDAASNFLTFFCEGLGTVRKYYYDEDKDDVDVLTGGSATVFTNVDCSSFMPPTSTLAYFRCDYNSSSSINDARFRPDGSTVAGGDVLVAAQVGLDTSSNYFYNFILNTSSTQIVEYSVQGAGDSLDLHVQGFEDNI